MTKAGGGAGAGGGAPPQLSPCAGSTSGWHDGNDRIGGTMICKACTRDDHTAGECENHEKPSIHHGCTCRTHEPKRPVAPYWQTLGDRERGRQ